MAKYMAQAAIALQVLMVLACVAWYMFWFTLPILDARNWIRSILDPKANVDFLGIRGLLLAISEGMERKTNIMVICMHCFYLLQV